MMIILDRDGVINKAVNNYIRTAAQWQPIEGSIEAIAELSKAGHTVTVATNQGGLALGLYSEEDLHAMHDKMCDLVTQLGGIISKVYYCPHHSTISDCNCRKPKPGMLNQIMQDFNLKAKNCIFVGDSGRDIEAAVAIGAQPVWVKTGNGQRDLAAYSNLAHYPAYDNLYAWSQAFL